MTTYFSSANRPTANAIADPLEGGIDININLIGGQGNNLEGGRYFDQRAVKADLSLRWQALSWGEFTAISAQYCGAPSGGMYLELSDYGNTSKTYHVIPQGRLHFKPTNTITGMKYDCDCGFYEV
jgi:hypothetical protein